MSSASDFNPKLLGMICNWCCYGGADLCGVSRLQYPPHIRLIRVMCSARVDLLHVFRAFSNGVDGMFIGGCHINDCHYITNGNYNALGMVRIAKKLLKHIGVNPERLRLEWVSAGEGIRFASVMNEFAPQIKKMGPLGKGEGIAPEELKLNLEAATRIIPFVKLVERERLRAPVAMRVSPDPEAAHVAFYESEAFDELFRKVVLNSLETVQIRLLLDKGAMTTVEISRRLGFDPSTVARHMNDASRHGWIRYDPAEKSFCIA